MDFSLDSTLLHLTRTRLLHEYPGQINACLDALDEEQIWWRPNEQANAVANLVLHLAGSNRYYLEHVIGGKEHSRDRDGEFAARGTMPKIDVQQTWVDAVRSVEAVLNCLDPSQLETSTDRSGKPTTFAQVLMHVSHHTAAHMGQIVWVTKMLQPGAINELWMKMRDARPLTP